MLVTWTLIAINLFSLYKIISFLRIKDLKSEVWNVERKVFINPWQRKSHVVTFRVLWEFLVTKTPKWPKKVSIQTCIPKLTESELVITNIGHATHLIQWKDVNILTDPVYEKRAGPFGFGPSRIKDPGVRFIDLPKIDVVIVSHNHYDHLCKKTVKRLFKVFSPQFIVPLGLKKILNRWGVNKNVIELDWWETSALYQLNFTAVPAQHWSRRGLFDINKTLWMGMVIGFEDKKVFFAGDTGWGPHFEQINERLGKINVGLLPIGAYAPRSVMKKQHMDPQAAVKAHKVLGCDISYPIHYDVFCLGCEGYGEAINDLNEALKQESIPQSQFPKVVEGESLRCNI